MDYEFVLRLVTHILIGLSAMIHGVLAIKAITILKSRRNCSLDEWYNQKFQETVTNPLKENGTTLETATEVLKRAEELKTLYEKLKQF